MLKVTGKFLINGTKKSTRSFDKMIPTNENDITTSNVRGFLSKYTTLLDNGSAVSGKLTKYTENEVTFE